jgi:mono/diheme cytochrome c family protein
MKRVLVTLFVTVILLAVVATVTAYLGLWPVAATSTPPKVEDMLAGKTLSASLARQSQGLTNPLSASPEVLSDGLKMFKANCAGCHGARGQPSMWGTQNFYPRVPQFADQAPTLNAPQMFTAIKYGIRYSGMGAWQGMMSDEQIWKVATFLENIDKLPPDVEALWKSQ